MKCRDIDKIDLTASIVKPMSRYNKVKTCVGLDTETQKGKNFLLAYYEHENKREILEGNNPDDILKFLNRRYFKDKFNFFYNVTYDFQAIIKTLPFENIKELAKRDKTIYNDWFIKVIPNKMFAITSIKKKDYSKFYDLAQFYNHSSLDNVGEKFVNMNKISLKELGIDITKLSYDKYKKDSDYRMKLRKYLYRDCKVTKLLADKLYSLLTPYINPKYFYSQASFSQQYFLENINERMVLPKKKIMQFALNGFQGGRFEVFRKGYFKSVNILDIKSAYPEQNVKVPNLAKGRWKETKEYDEEALVQLFKIDTDIHDLNISPAKYQLKDNLLTYPIGKFKDMYVNKQELKCITDLGFKVKIEKGYSYYDNEPEYPFTFLNKFFDLKEQFKKDNKDDESMTPKIIMNGFYGKNIQVVKSFRYTTKYEGDKDLNDILLMKGKRIYEYNKFIAGKLFNPIVANEITANTRVKLFEAVKKYEKNIIGFQTDSIITDKKIPLKFGDKLGDWEVENRNQEMIMLGSGVYQLLGSNPKVRLRGFSKNLDLQNEIKNNLGSDKISIELLRNNKLKKTMKRNLNPEEKVDLFNQLLYETKTININFDRKRIWNRNFENCQDVFNSQIKSKPLII